MNESLEKVGHKAEHFYTESVNVKGKVGSLGIEFGTHVIIELQSGKEL
ncbi:MAG: hypothetical protein Greene041679_119 [Parcubacteria group bacterium Greene0416_79]|nr:MAG: hypothetical protein Greene041679_119 [Parcubacteria group bacterium Greene0416_79]